MKISQLQALDFTLQHNGSTEQDNFFVKLVVKAGSDIYKGNFIKMKKDTQEILIYTDAIKESTYENPRMISFPLAPTIGAARSELFDKTCTSQLGKASKEKIVDKFKVMKDIALKIEPEENKVLLPYMYDVTHVSSGTHFDFIDMSNIEDFELISIVVSE